VRICFYAPFKPLDHPNPSGDLAIGKGISRFLKQQGHSLWTPSFLRLRWIYFKPWLWILFLRDRGRVLRKVARSPRKPDLWLTYHSYYKAPDLLGPAVARRLGIPYAIFQGIYATKTRRHIKTWPGYFLNTRALLAARHIFTNKQVDLKNLKRVIPEKQLTYIPPGIDPSEFFFDRKARFRLHSQWQVHADPVILAAAMFRPDVKTRGLAWLIESLGALYRQGEHFFLVIAGDGTERKHIEPIAEKHLPGRVRFLGLVPRGEMHRFYSAGDCFAFPGIGESLGMVYLEAQACGLPVVAFENGGIPEVVRDGQTGYLTPMYDSIAFNRAVLRLLDTRRRNEMGRQAVDYVRKRHDLNSNYRILTDLLERIAEKNE
jgi:phosphatidyl-myo-inositol dimannoside synthase